jgi:hypothetical protein
MIEGIVSPLSIVAHDAGAANHIFAWLSDDKPTLCLEGPARALWLLSLQKTGHIPSSESWLVPERDNLQSPFTQSGLAAAISGAATVITGTGWESSLEHDARKLARDQGIRSIAVIDHWINYADRFVRNGQEVLPDEIWVTDSYALDIAQAAFPTVNVIQQSNAYLAGLLKEVKSCQSTPLDQGNDRVLYVLEPIRHLWGELPELGEFLALDYFMAQLQRSGVALDAEIRLRAHPSDPPGKYDSWLNKQGNPRVIMDRAGSLAESLTWSNVVVGCQTYAMVLALACGRTVISSIPPWAPPCTLPQLDIRHLSRISI